MPWLGSIALIDSYASSFYGHPYSELFPSPTQLRPQSVPVVLQAAHAGDIPEPSSFALIAGGIVALTLHRNKNS